MKKRKQISARTTLSTKLYNAMAPIPNKALSLVEPSFIGTPLWSYLSFYFKPFNK